MEAVSDESSFSRNSREQNEGNFRSGNLILWVAAIAVLLGLNFASWSFCMWVFGQPEHPMNYRLLTRLDKLDPIRGFLPSTAPRGKFFSPKDLYAQVYPFNATELGAYNGILKRHYLENYEERDDVIFISGEFRVESVQRMDQEDVFSSGIVIRARSTAFPDVVLDLALPSESPPETFKLNSGQVIQLEESSTCAAVLHIERLEDAVMIVTAVPLVTRVFSSADASYGPRPYEFGENPVVMVVTPPRIRLERHRWPISVEEERPVENSESTEAEEDAGGEAEAGASEPDKEKG